MKKVSLLALLALLAIGCVASESALDDVAAASEDALRIDGEGSERYFEVTPDYRRCIRPLCGGYWISRANDARTRCADGSWSEACYVAEVDLSALHLESTAMSSGRHVVVRGAMTPTRIGGWEVAIFEATEAWQSVTSEAPAGPLLKVADTGSRCVSTPCDSKEGAFLNRPWWFAMESVDLSAMAMSDEQHEAVAVAMASDAALFAGPYALRFQGGDLRLQVWATQAYLPMRAEVEPDLCARVRCASGTVCEVGDEGARCVSDGTLRCGDSTCGAGDVCCNPSCGICTPPGYACIQLAC